MIYYYSATGNSRYAARYLAEKLGDEIKNLLNQEHEGAVDSFCGDTLGLVFPIYCWGIPPVVNDFICNISSSIQMETYVWMVCTCGDEAGKAMKKIDRQIKRFRGRGADAIFSLIMPNTYVMLPGFNVDPLKVEQNKLDRAPGRLDEITYSLKSKQKGIYEVKEGSLPTLRSLIFPLFKKWGVQTGWWRSSSQCIGCGGCANVCPAQNISMNGNRPQWGRKCYSCCACYHVCPVKAIEYGSFTKGKGQYVCPL